MFEISVDICNIKKVFELQISLFEVRIAIWNYVDIEKKVFLENLFELSSNKYLLSSNKYSNKYRLLDFVQIQIQIRKNWPNLVQINTNTKK